MYPVIFNIAASLLWSFSVVLFCGPFFVDGAIEVNFNTTLDVPNLTS